MKVDEVMTISDDDSLVQAVSRLERHGYGRLPAIHRDGEKLGYFDSGEVPTRPSGPLKPPGEMFETMATLACAHPQVQFVFEHKRDGVVVCQWNNIHTNSTRE